MMGLAFARRGRRGDLGAVGDIGDEGEADGAGNFGDPTADVRWRLSVVGNFISLQRPPSGTGGGRAFDFLRVFPASFAA